ncbi:hypothetical protein MLD52_06505 [Puniceicoccaceae bacterium K14]|nr:hypothetical protein [Puniceicoccaceae bacterium K14]
MGIERVTAALISLQESIRNTNSEQILESIREIDLAKVEEKNTMDAQLRHYLRNRSYEKALMYIQGASNIEKGRCSGRTDFS